MACSLVSRICDCWQVCATTNATPSTATMMATRRGPQRPASVCCSGSWTELVPHVREQHDHEDHDDTENRDGEHRELEALDMSLQRQERDLPLAASAVGHAWSPTPPGCGGGPSAGVVIDDGPSENRPTCLISWRFS